MKDKGRKLTEKELKRKAHFEVLRAEMQELGYTEKPLIVGIVEANVWAAVIMLPFIIAAGILFFAVNSIGSEISLRFSALLLPVLLVMIVLHELIHGLVWGCFARNHFSSIEFGVIWKALTPYCTCSEPLTKWQYVLGGAMPTLVLGFGLAAAAAATGQLVMLLLAELMILSGGGDFLIILKILLYRPGHREVVYYDHPYECGVVAFER